MDHGLTIRAPRYLTRFQCIGAACEDNCCAGWQNVDVDEVSYARYRELHDAELGPALRQHVRLNPEPTAGPEDRALIAVPEAGQCPFFTTAGLCAIQRSLGEALLPAGCDTFPRQATLIDGVADLAGRLSCPEVTRLALLEPEALELMEVQPDRRLVERARYWVETPWLDNAAEDDPRYHYHRLRALCVALLRRREHSLEARLMALGRALSRLSDWPTLDRAEVEQAFEEAENGFACLDGALDSEELDSARPPEMVLRRVRVWVAMPGIPPRYRACLDRLRDGLAIPADASAPLGHYLRERYGAGRTALRAYLARRPWTLEHALLNVVLTGTFPFHPDHSFAEAWAILAFRHALLTLHLVGAAAWAGRLSDELLVETVQAFEKYADSPDYWERTLSLLRREHALSESRVAALLR